MVSAVLTAVLYWYGLTKFYFWYYPWYDIPMHLAGGLTIGLWAISLAWRRRYSPFQALIFVLLLAIGIGLLWELFESTTGLTGGQPGYWLDTLGDLGNDVGGALFAWFFYWLLSPREDTLQ